MSKFFVAISIGLFLISMPSLASAAPRTGADAHPSAQAASSNASQPQVMSDEDMGKVVGGEINVGGGGTGGTGTGSGTPPNLANITALIQQIEQDITQLEQLLRQDFGGLGHGGGFLHH